MPQLKPGTVQVGEVEREEVPKLHFVDVRVEVLGVRRMRHAPEGTFTSDRW